MKKHQQNSICTGRKFSTPPTLSPFSFLLSPFSFLLSPFSFLLFSLLLSSFLLFSGCKKEKENKPDPGGGGTEKLTPPAWIQGNWKMKSTGHVYQFTSGNIMVDLGHSSVGFIKYTEMLFGGNKYTVTQNTGTTLYTIKFDVAGGQGVQGGKTYLYSFKKVKDNSIEYAQYTNGRKEQVVALEKTNGGGGGEEVKLTGIKFQQSEAAPVEGNSTYLTLLPVPDNASLPKCNFSSDNENVATVNSYGMVTGVAVGQTTIRATTEDGKFTANIPVVVLENTPENKLTGINFNNSEYSVPVGTAFVAELVPVPYMASLPICNFSSDNTSIATVNDGMVTAVAAGQTIIRATTADGNNFTASLTLTVTQNVVELTGIKFENSQISIPAGTVYNTKILPVPSTATLPDCYYTSDNIDIATVNPNTGVVKAIYAGQTTIRATTGFTAYGEFTTECIVTVTEPQGEFTYREPYLKFGCDRSTVKNYETREIDSEGDGFILYGGENGFVQIVQYAFSENKFYSAAVYLYGYSNTETQVKEFLSKKYQYQGWNIHYDNTHEFHSSDGKMWVLLSSHPDGRWIVEYLNLSEEKSAQNNMRKIGQYPIIKK